MRGLDNLSVAVSIDGIGPDHDYIRGKGSFDKSDGVIRAMMAGEIEVEVMFTVTSYNIERYMPVLEYCKKLGVTCNFNLFKPFRRNHSALVPDPTKFFSLIMTLFDLRRSGKYSIGLANAALTGCLMGLPDRNECRAVQAGLVIDVHGRMLTCPSLLYCGCYSENDFPAFDEHFIETWKNTRCSPDSERTVLADVKPDHSFTPETSRKATLMTLPHSGGIWGAEFDHIFSQSMTSRCRAFFIS
jgi:MoaA/NifB/PqqE/SkfB family radical SAM enzyme